MIAEPLHELAVPLAELTPHPENARQGDVGALVISLERNGQYRPIVVNRRSNVILAGNHTYLAAQKLGWEEIAVTWVDVDEAGARRILLVDNRTNDLAAYDDPALAELLKEIVDDDGLDGLLGTGFDGDDLDELLSDLDRGWAGEDEPPLPPVPDVAQTEPGDVWSLGDHSLICGDSSQVERPGWATVTVLDPPYEMQESKWLAHLTDPTILFGQAKHLRAVPAELWRFERVIDKVTAHRSATVQVGHRHAFVAQCGSEKVLPRDRKVTLPSVVQNPDRPDHPHSKPVWLLREHLTHWTPLGGVFEPFAGSGSGLIACCDVRRRWFGVELDPAYCDVIVRRWAEHTGQEPRRDSGKPFDLAS